jgi:SagB-type dehydrogenase family enzyme
VYGKVPVFAIIGAVSLSMGLAAQFREGYASDREKGKTTPLPRPRLRGKLSLAESLQERKSTRHYLPGPLKITEVSQLLWAAQGTNRTGGYRTAPSAGSLYPLEVYLLSGDIEGLPAGLYRYIPSSHALETLSLTDHRRRLCDDALGQKCVEEGAAAVVLAAVFSRTEVKYGERSVRYVHMEAGAAAQNVYLQAAALGLGTVFIGAFDDRRVQRTLGLPPSVEPLAIMPVGRR